MDVYIANDVEAAGRRLGFHSMLSIGACVVAREPMTFREYEEKGLIFYAEIKPDFLNYEIEAMKIGCLHLKCLDEIRKSDPRYDPTHFRFHPTLVLEHMLDVCEEAESVAQRFVLWLKSKAGEGGEIVGVTDTVFFDGGHIDLLFGNHLRSRSPYGYSGLDLDSLYRGLANRADASLGELPIKDNREKPHRADHDAAFLAQRSRYLLFEKMGW